MQCFQPPLYRLTFVTLQSKENESRDLNALSRLEYNMKAISIQTYILQVYLISKFKTNKTVTASICKNTYWMLLFKTREIVACEALHIYLHKFDRLISYLQVAPHICGRRTLMSILIAYVNNACHQHCI